MTTKAIAHIDCTQCGKPCIHLKALLDHYELYHPELLKRYSITNKLAGAVLTTFAPDADIIISSQGWNKEDCKIAVI